MVGIPVDVNVRFQALEVEILLSQAGLYRAQHLALLGCPRQLKLEVGQVKP